MMFKFIHLFFLDWELSYIVPMSVVFTFFREHTLLAAVPASLRQEFILHCALPTLVLSDYRLASQWTWHLPHTRRYIQWTHTGSHSWKPSNKPLFRRFQIFLDHFPCYRDISWYPWWGMRAIRRKPNRRNRVLLNHYDDLWWSMMYPRAMALAQDEWKAVGSYLTRKNIDFAEVTNPAESISKGLQGKLL